MTISEQSASNAVIAAAAIYILASSVSVSDICIYININAEIYCKINTTTAYILIFLKVLDSIVDTWNRDKENILYNF